MSEANAASSDPLIGTRLDGRYTIHGILGHGGMGVVYEGVHDDLGRVVAIKVLNTAWAADRTAVERFLREARMASSFSHGNIVDVSDLGRLSDGRPYLVMPKITGTDLNTLLGQTGPQPARRVADLLSGVGSALDLIHAKGYVHRDIKPENLMYVVREDGSETVMLLDFGIAKLVMSNEPRLTGQGAVFGTPHFMPPEAWGGALHDASGDVYALATVVFELVTGVLPFESDNVMQLLNMKLGTDAPSLATVTGREFPVELEAVMARSLARKPELRYASASEFVAELKAATQHAPVSWRPGVLRSSLRSDEHPVGAARAYGAHYPHDEHYARDEHHEHDEHDGYEDATTRDTHRSDPSLRQRATPASWADEDAFGEGLRASERHHYRSTKRMAERSHWLRSALLIGGAGALVAVGLVLSADRTAVPPQSVGSRAAPNNAPAAAPALPQPSPQPPAAAQHAAPPAQPATIAAPIEQQPTAAAPTPPAAVPPPAEAPAPPAVSSSPPPTAAGLPVPTPTQPAAKPRERETAAAATRPARPAVPAPETAPPEPIAPDHAAEEPDDDPTAAMAAPVLTVKQDTTPAPAEVPARDPARAKLLTREATGALLRGEVGRAVDLLRDATRADSSQAAVWRTLGVALERAGNGPQAIDAYQHYLRLAPTGPQADMVRERTQALEK
jgi:serine/threonine-protein kinase